MQNLFARVLAIVVCVATTTVTASPAPAVTTCQTCWTRTTTLPPPSCPTNSFNAATCITPDCIALTTTTVGTKSCNNVVTVTPACPTACAVGCRVSTSTVTDSAKCIGGPSCYTATATSYTSRVCPVNYIQCVSTPTGCGPATVTTTQPGAPPGAKCVVTSTVTSPSACPTNGCGCRTTTVTVTAN